MHPRVSVPDFDTVWTNIEKSAGDISERTAWMGQWRGVTACFWPSQFLSGCF